MRRPSLKSLPTSWRKVATLALFFGLGVAADRLVMLVSPLVYRVVSVRSIHGTTDKGCIGSAGDYYALFGRPAGQSDGIYATACGGHTYLSDTTALFCDCD